MIYTLTVNPSLDYITFVDHLILGEVNRSTKEQIFPGGKGINVSIVLKNLGFENEALGFIAGFTGKEVEKSLKELGCVSDFIQVEKGITRINVKVKSKDITEINGQGPQITQKEMEKLYKKLDQLVEGDILILAGNIPNSMPKSLYADIMKRCTSKNLKIVVDATGDLLINVLKQHPFLIKPNKHELEELFNVTLKSIEDIEYYGKKLQQIGAQNVLISLAEKGALLIAEDQKIYYSKAPKGNLVNSVGSGDSMVAGFVAGFLESENYQHALKMGICAGSASAFSEKLATREEVEHLMEKLEECTVYKREK
ncbi:1-phosphofructokinase [Garciella nitratireducens]|uniref:Tagatose-6-phosphate kinase n=1 Tax=Garciella nitratireducens DSM 15102 TaxID=1121911 RepID=A0A1T4M4U3_9FIRM|nr:1-phosphofructokinase [Garciella nitratireducens]RBP44033.1 fructose-1-phosphate kinase [Garciella nitratireducens]SJZ61915.1 fructose-1-phosphate kinase [Garciella nitratireducens DSM 15102]